MLAYTTEKVLYTIRLTILGICMGWVLVSACSDAYPMQLSPESLKQLNSQGASVLIFAATVVFSAIVFILGLARRYTQTVTEIRAFHAEFDSQKPSINEWDSQTSTKELKLAINLIADSMPIILAFIVGTVYAFLTGFHTHPEILTSLASSILTIIVMQEMVSSGIYQVIFND